MKSPISCERCGKPFIPAKAIRRFCSKSCSARSAWASNPGRPSKPKNGRDVVCAFCGKTFYVPACRSTTARYCSLSCHGKRQGAPNLLRAGFRETGKAPRRYQRINVNGRNVYLHRWLMEQHIGRPLTFADKVHHINGDTLDNRLENLLLVTQRQHSGIEWQQHRLIYHGASE